jgi:hypothetical protein
MLARRARALLASEPLLETRRRLRRDPGRLVPAIDSCLGAVEAENRPQAIDALRQIILLIGDTDLTGTPARTPRLAGTAIQPH